MKAIATGSDSGMLDFNIRWQERLGMHWSDPEMRRMAARMAVERALRGR